MTSAWLESYGDVNRYNFALDRADPDGRLRPHRREFRQGSGRATGNVSPTSSASAPWATTTRDFLNYYYYMAVAVRGFRSLVLARLQQEHAEPHRNLDGRHDAGTGARPVRRRPLPQSARYHNHLPGTRQSRRVVEDLLLGDRGRLHGQVTATAGKVVTPTTTRSRPSPISPIHKYLYENPQHAGVHGPNHRLAAGGRRSHGRLLHRPQSHRAHWALHDDVANNTLAQLRLHRSGLRPERRTSGIGTVDSDGPATGRASDQCADAKPVVGEFGILPELRRGRRAIRSRSAGRWPLQSEYRQRNGLVS